MSRELRGGHEDVVGGACPRCGQTLGTVWVDDECTYFVEPHGHMGNKSYRDDTQVGVWCASAGCDYKKIKEVSK